MGHDPWAQAGTERKEAQDASIDDTIVRHAEIAAGQIRHDVTLRSDTKTEQDRCNDGKWSGGAEAKHRNADQGDGEKAGRDPRSVEPVERQDGKYAPDN